MELRIAGQPILTITGDTFSASVSVAAYDDGWFVEQTTIIVTGQLTEPNLMGAFKESLKLKAEAWRTQLTAKEALKAKLAELVGKSL